jgi:pimeloyl-ACP methyl ester carboxylesterase
MFKALNYVVSFGLLILGCPISPAWCTNTSMPPASAFAALPATADADISPNGRLIAMGDLSGSQEKVVVFDADSGKTRTTLGMEKATKLRRVRWLDDETVLVDFSFAAVQKVDFVTNRYEFWRTIALDVNTGKNRLLLMQEGARDLVTGAYMISRHTSTPKHVVMSTMDWSQSAFHEGTGTRLANERKDSGWIWVLYDVDAQTGKGKPIERGTQYTEDWLIFESGEPAIRSDWNPQSSSYQLLAKRNGGWKEIYRSAGDDMRLVALSEDQSAAYVLATGSSGYKELWSIALDGSGRKSIVADATQDVLASFEDPLTGRLVGVNLGSNVGEVKWLEPAAEAQFQRLTNTFRDKLMAIRGRSKDSQRVIVRVSGPSEPAMFYLVDFTSHRADIVGEEYSALAGVALGTVRQISYKARDGLEIPAYITFPPGKEAAKHLPMIVLPHGGPEAHDELGFDWWRQYLATRGYLVLQPQFRGSTGFGDKFRLAGRGEWGGLMQHDVTDGVHAVIEQELADPKRVCIVGHDYGGYAALMGAASTPTLYRCAVSVAGVTDLSDMLATIKNKWGDYSNQLGYWRTSLGSPLDPRFPARSPTRLVANIQIPILLIHGEGDSVVPITQSEKLANLLELSNHRYKFVRLPGEDHWVSRADTRLQILTEIETFLKQNLPVDAE